MGQTYLLPKILEHKNLIPAPRVSNIAPAKNSSIISSSFLFLKSVEAVTAQFIPIRIITPLLYLIKPPNLCFENIVPAI